MNKTLPYGMGTLRDYKLRTAQDWIGPFSRMDCFKTYGRFMVEGENNRIREGIS